MKTYRIAPIIAMVLTAASFTSATDSAAVAIGQSDSAAAVSSLSGELAQKTGTALALSISGLSLNLAGDLLPWLLANPKNSGSAGTFLITGLVFVTGGSTMACVGTNVIRKWSTDHIKDPPETHAWLTYKIGIALTYMGALAIALGVGAHSLEPIADYGIPAYLAGEVCFLISSIQSVAYASSVNSKREKKAFELIAMPTINLHGGAGFIMEISLLQK
jgi:hypothetical protein